MTHSPEHGVVAITGTYPISRELLGKIVDDVFDGAIEDASVIEQIYAAIKKHEPHPPKPGSRGIPVGEIVAASTPAAEILYGLDVKFYEALRSLPIGTQLYAASVDSAVDPQPSAENVGDDECDHKGKGLAVMSWGACCAGCGEPHPFDAPQPTVAITDGVVATPAPAEHVEMPIASWREQAAFEAWAKERRYEMGQHPLHYLFTDKKTNAARQGWKAALAFVRKMSEGSL